MKRSESQAAIAATVELGELRLNWPTSSTSFTACQLDQPAHLAAGGRLQMLAIKDRPNYDTRKVSAQTNRYR